MRSWHRSVWGFIRRTLESADENNVPFLASALSFDALLAAVPFALLLLVLFTVLVQGLAPEGTTLDPDVLFHRFLPPHNSTPGSDPFGPVERLLTRIFQNRGNLSLVVVPTFLWFSTRLFASMRNSLNFVYDVGSRPGTSRGFISNYLRGKSRDALLALTVATLFLVNTVLSAALTLLRSRSEAAIPAYALVVGTVGRLFAEIVAFVFSISLFFVMYRFASPRRMNVTSVLIASTFSAFGFEVAKRLYGLYLARSVLPASAFGGGAQLGALILFVLWVYYMAVVFLIGGVVAERWEALRLQRRQGLVV
ncbi:MAG: ribonuclease [Gemmatimonadetes bacterium]|nr:ribonuclease [Gemmatimonadota bacterium]